MNKDNTDLPKGITHRADGRYQGRITYRGKRHTLYGKTVKELQKKINNLQYELEHGIYVKEEEITIQAWFETWIQVYKVNSVKNGTVDTYKQCFEKYISSKLGKLKLKEVRPEQIQKFYNELKKNGYANATIDLVSTILSSIFKQAVKNEIIQKNPILHTTKPKDRKKSEKESMTVAEQTIFMKWVGLSKYANIYRIALFTGMRAGEIRALEWEDIDFRSQVIYVRGTLKYHKDRGYYKDTPKTISSQRSIPMLEEVARFFKDERKKQSENRMRNANIYTLTEGLENLVFTNEIGMPISHDALNVNLKKLINKINEKVGTEIEVGIKTKVTPHILRHTFATRGLEKGIKPRVMQDMLGHSSITMTMDLYSHVLPDMKADEMKKMGSLL